MKVIDKRIEALEGERFSQIMSGFDFAAASQIVVLLYQRESTPASGFAKSYVKVADAVKYPAATLITLNENGKMVFTIDTDAMAVGDYDIEVSVNITGVAAPILKNRTFFLTIIESRT